MTCNHQNFFRGIAIPLLGALIGLLPATVRAVIPVTGLSTNTTYSGSVTFSVAAEAGYVTTCSLDGSAINAAAGYTEARAGYHELFASKSPIGGGAAETLLVRFIVVDPARGTPDTGLSSWTPRELVPAPAAALDETLVEWIVPTAAKPGETIPLVVRLTTASGESARLNARVVVDASAGAATSFLLYRGSGAGQWTAPATGGTIELRLHVGSRTIAKSVQVAAVASPYVMPASITANLAIPAGTNVDVTGDVAISAGATLSIAAGCTVRVAPGATIDVLGRVESTGNIIHPVVVTQRSAGQPWGGFYFHGGSAGASLVGTIFTGAGASATWISSKGLSAHKPEQPVLAFDAGTTGGTCVATVTDCWVVDNPSGQASHGRNADVTFTRCLIQRTRTTGQFNNGNFRLRDSHVVEIPVNSSTFVDGDNDGFYLNGGNHELTDSVIGWTKDDGMDSGGDAVGQVVIDRCWFEACFHEGLAWSGDKIGTVIDSVFINCGQGIECGYSNTSSTLARPDVTATGCLLFGNNVGARFGDSYNWTYRGKLAVDGSMALQNIRDVWGMEWASWTYRSADMNIAGNVFSAASAQHPGNAVFSPALDSATLAGFLSYPGGPRGFALAGDPSVRARSAYGGSIEVLLDRPATVEIPLPWKVVAGGAGGEITVAEGSLTFPAGGAFATVTLPALSGPAAAMPWIAFSLGTHPQAIATGAFVRHFVYLETGPPTTLVAANATWKYLADGTNQGTAWRAPGFAATSWASGPAELGYGNGDEATVVPYVDVNAVTSGIQKNATTYFRHVFQVADPSAYAALSLACRYDDGVVVYLNGTRVAAAGAMPTGEPAYNYYTGTTSANNAEFTATVAAAHLVSGSNTLAAEVHQSGDTSSDISFRATLTATLATPVTISQQTGKLGGLLHVFWSTPGVIPQTSTNLVDWRNRPDLASPHTILPDGVQGFFRLRLDHP